MLYSLQNILDFVFPPTMHELLLRRVTGARFIGWYRPHTRAGVTYLTEYHLPEVKAAIAATKFEHSYHAAKLLGQLVSVHLQTLPPKNTLLIPIPLSKKRLRKRGFNQVDRVLRHVDSIPYPYAICTSLLIRLLDTIPQTSLSRAKRLNNMNGAFALQERNKFQLENIERIIICDDVTTTGTTLAAARKILSPHLPPTTELITLAFAH